MTSRTISLIKSRCKYTQGTQDIMKAEARTVFALARVLGGEFVCDERFIQIKQGVFILFWLNKEIYRSVLNNTYCIFIFILSGNL